VLTEAEIRNAKPGIHWDGSLKGFGLRVGKRRKTFIVLVASGRRKAIGTWPLVNLATARAEARRILAEKTLGKVRPPRTPFEDALKAYLAECATRTRPRTLRDYSRLLTKHYPFGRRAVAEIPPREIVQRLNPLPPGERAHAQNAGKIFFRWCERQHLIERSPMEHLARLPHRAPRERVLSEDELRAVWTTARASTRTFERIICLCLLTGQRRGEIASLQWEWINGDMIHMPAAYVKNRRDHVYPLSPEAQAILASVQRIDGSLYVFPASRQISEATTVFNGFGKEKARFDRACGVTDWTLHDLRRTVATCLQKLGTRTEVIEALLNHVGSRAGIIGVYQRYDWLPEQRDAILKLEAFVASMSNSRETS
jgi:integrase